MFYPFNLSIDCVPIDCMDPMPSLYIHLLHPKIGLWFTADLDEAQNMLNACHEYLEAIKADSIKDEFVIVDVETGEEILS